MSKICLCLTGKTIAKDLALIEKYRRYIDVAELRVDCLMPDEQEEIRYFPERAAIPVILTVRRKSDGGFFDRGEASRIVLMSKALAFARSDKRKNFSYVDIEEDLDTPGVEEIARAFDTRVIRSFHNINETDTDIESRMRALFHVGDEIAKAAVMPHNLDDVRRLIKTAKKFHGMNTIMMSMADMGQCTRVLAAKFGSYLTYVSPREEDGVVKAAPGQLDPVTLSELYRFRSINEHTAIYGITGYPLITTLSPEFHNAVFERENTNAVYLRFPAATPGEFMRLAADLELRGASVTVPHKENIIQYLSRISPNVQAVGACNTMVRTPHGWSGYNTDAPGFSGSLLALTGRSDFKRLRATVIGAGGAARAVVSELHRLGAKGIILNRTAHKARELADRYRFEAVSLDDDRTERLIKKNSDIIVQTTSVGMEPDTGSDPLPGYRFSGRETVMDVIYKPEVTRFLERARSAGCATINGYDMLIRQAKLQYECFFDKAYPEDPPPPR